MKAIPIALVLLLCCTLFDCADPAKIEIDSDYYPLKENSEWKYLRKLFTGGGDNSPLWSDTIINKIKGDTLLDGIKYKKVIDQQGILVKAVRKQEGKYYGRNHELYGGFAKEYLFLDDKAELNTVWRHYKNDSITVTEYRVKALNSTRTYNNIEYHGVTELEVNYYYRDGKDFALNYSTQHYYARGIGEIYSYYPYPSLMYGDLYLSLLK
jgi:hypothetical protein